MKSPPYFPFFQRDFVHSCRSERMTPDEIGGLVMVMCQQWENLGHIASDPAKFAAYAGWDIRVAKRLLARLSEIGKISLDQRGYHSTRMTDEITKYIARVKAAEAREAEKVKGGFGRTSDDLPPNFSEKSEISSPELSKKRSKNNDGATREAPLPDIRYQIEKEKKKDMCADAHAEANFIDDAFDAFWNAFPAKRRRGKVDARKAFVAIATGKHPRKLRATPDEIVAAVRAGRGFDPDEPPMPTTWLNGGRWLDDDPKAQTAPDTRPWWQVPERIAAAHADPEKLKGFICQHANGIWPLDKLGPPFGHPGTVVTAAIADELGLVGTYDRNGMLRPGRKPKFDKHAP